MRVLRTELYFDEMEPWGSGGEDTSLTPGIAAAFFKIPDEPQDPNHREIIESLLADLEWIDDSHREREYWSFVSGAIMNRFFSASWEEEVSYPEMVSAALNAPVVIENSRTTTLPLGTLLSKAPGVAIGTFVGIQAAGLDGGPLMLLTVPGGILAVSSAIVISRILEQGFNRYISRRFPRRVDTATPKADKKRSPTFPVKQE